MNPLDATMDWYRTAYDALRVARRVVRRTAAGVVLPRHVFHDLPEADCFARLDIAVKELDNLTILALVAVFERILRDHAVSVIQNRFDAPPPVEAKISEHVQKDTEFWNFSARLVDVFANVDPLVRGQVKQFIDFRNWVAHARHAAASPEPAPINVIPRDAYQVLTDFLQQAGLV